MTDITLHPLEAADESFSFRVYASTRTDEMALLDWSQEEKEAFLSMQFAAQSQSYRMQFPDARYEIIQCDGIAVGRLITSRTPELLSVTDIALLPEFRGRGVGSEIIRRLQAEAAANGQALGLHVEVFNPAQHLYQRLGFVTKEVNGIHMRMEWYAQC